MLLLGHMLPLEEGQTAEIRALSGRVEIRALSGRVIVRAPADWPLERAREACLAALDAPCCCWASVLVADAAPAQLRAVVLRKNLVCTICGDARPSPCERCGAALAEQLPGDDEERQAAWLPWRDVWLCARCDGPPSPSSWDSGPPEREVWSDEGERW
jgi:hypothetical protein